MKSQNLRVFAFAIFSLFLFTRCQKSDNLSSSGTEQILVQNVWTVNYFYSGQDMTSSYNSARLLFSATGDVGIQKNGVTIAGTWKHTVDSKIEWLHLEFPSDDPNIQALNKSWKLADCTSSLLELKQTDGATQLDFRLASE